MCSWRRWACKFLYVSVYSILHYQCHTVKISNSSVHFANFPHAFVQNPDMARHLQNNAVWTGSEKHVLNNYSICFCWLQLGMLTDLHFVREHIMENATADNAWRLVRKAGFMLLSELHLVHPLPHWQHWLNVAHLRDGVSVIYIHTTWRHYCPMAWCHQ